MRLKSVATAARECIVGWDVAERGRTAEGVVLDGKTPKLMVGLLDPSTGNWVRGYAQPLDQFRKSPDARLLVLEYGRPLLGVLTDDLAYTCIDPTSKKLKLKYIALPNESEDGLITRLMGKIAEAVLVRRCREDSKVNALFAEVARRGKLTDADKYIAVGTGLIPTRDQYRKHYNPGDPQRDILWLSKFNGMPLLQEGSSTECGVAAGLQLKCSRNGRTYVAPDLKKDRYEVPVVYFDLAGDFDDVARAAAEPFRQGMLIRGRSVDEYTWQLLESYAEVLKSWIKNEDRIGGIDPDWDEALKDAVVLSKLNP